jgi:hypothetical protein
MASPIDDTTRKEEAVDFSLRPNLSEHLLTDLEDASSREQLVEQHDFRVQRSPWKSTAEFKSRAEGFGIAPILMSVHRRPFSCEGAPRSSNRLVWRLAPRGRRIRGDPAVSTAGSAPRESLAVSGDHLPGLFDCAEFPIPLGRVFGFFLRLGMS